MSANHTDPAHELVDRLAVHKALVFGSLPPHGQDIDLLVRAAHWDSFARRLAEAGFARRRQTFARFRDCSVDVVDLVPAESWKLPTNTLENLFECAQPIEGKENLVRPAGHHVLLILARRFIREGEDLEPKKRKRIEQVLAEAPTAWQAAGNVAPEWGAATALELLEKAFLGQPASSLRRTRAMKEELRGAGVPLAGPRAARSLLKRPKRGAVITLSGLDGAGKSSQAKALATTLARLGYDVSVTWTRFGQEPLLDHLATLVKRVIRPSRARSSTETPHASGRGDATSITRKGFVTWVWTCVVSLSNAISHRRATAARIRQGGIVICDRYVLDSAVHMRRKYGLEKSYRLQTMIIRALSPSPLRSYLLDVSAATAATRKEDVYSEDALRVHGRLYGEMFERFGVIRVDGELPEAEICYQIATDTWAALAGG